MIHYIVVRSVSNNNVRIFDPAPGIRTTIDKYSFLNRWTGGYIMRIYPEPIIFHKEDERKNE